MKENHIFSRYIINRIQAQTLLENLASFLEEGEFWMTTTNMNCIERFSPYRAVNTLHLGYRKPWVQENNRCLFQADTKHNIVCGRNVKWLNFKLGGTYRNHSPMIYAY